MRRREFIALLGGRSPLCVTHPPRERRLTAVLRDCFAASNSPLPHRWPTPPPQEGRHRRGGQLAK